MRFEIWVHPDGHLCTYSWERLDGNQLYFLFSNWDAQRRQREPVAIQRVNSVDPDGVAWAGYHEVGPYEINARTDRGVNRALGVLYASFDQELCWAPKDCNTAKLAPPIRAMVEAMLHCYHHPESYVAATRPLNLALPPLPLLHATSKKPRFDFLRW